MPAAARRCGGKSLPPSVSADHDQSRGSKDERFAGSLAEVEAGNFLLPMEASGLPALRLQLVGFSSGRHDDQVDSFSQFVENRRRHWKWVMTEHDEDGRAIDVARPCCVQCHERPALQSLRSPKRQCVATFSVCQDAGNVRRRSAESAPDNLHFSFGNPNAQCRGGNDATGAWEE